MDILEANTIALLARRVGLLTEAQLQEIWQEVDRKSGSAGEFLAVAERKGWLTPYQSGKLVKGEDDGYLLGGYKLLYKISSGSFGRVFRAEDPTTGRVVAIKVLRRRWSEDKQRIEMFMREGRVGMTLQHPNIVEILNVSQDLGTGQYFIVMEFVEGGNLREILALGRMDPARALKLLEDCVNGLAYAFSKGLTHRDIKLTNILVSSQGVAKLVDFGLAQLFSAGMKEEEKIERTVDYAGLEKATGVKYGDVRSDIFFLGCVAYEMLTGRRPLEHTRDRHARMNPRRFQEIPPIKVGEIAGPPSIIKLVETMMAFNPAQRYQTPSQLLDAVRSVRRELEGGKRMRDSGAPSIFVVESDDRLQEAIRNKFKEMGLRVFLAADPMRAWDRYRQNPYDLLLIDAGTTGEDGLVTFDRILLESNRHNAGCQGILILNQDQEEWVHRVQSREGASILLRPVTMKQLKHKIQELLGTDDNDGAEEG